MSGVVVEIATWPASEAYKADPTIITPGLEPLTKTKGVQKIWHGLQHEDHSTVHLIIIWDTLADHQALIDDKPTYARLAELLAPSLGGPLSLFHVAFEPIVAPVDHFNSPIAEIVIQTIKEGQKAEDLRDLLTKSSAGGKVLVFGKIVERENQFVLVKGWASVEDHVKTAKTEEFQQFLKALGAIITGEVRHVPLTLHTA